MEPSWASSVRLQEYVLIRIDPSVPNHCAPGDVVTTPILPMLKAIAKTTLRDDFYREDQTTYMFEEHIADLVGHEAGMFVLSGTMGNQIALRTHLMQPPHSVLCDARSHIVHREAGGLASLSGAMLQAVAPRNDEWLTLEDIKLRAVLSDDVHHCPTAVISLENTISGLVHPLNEIQRISSWARQNEVKLHLDGARLWEADAAGGGSLRDYAICFDSVSLDFSKGLGAPMGAMILGNKGYVSKARRIRKSIGGGMRQAGVLSGPALSAINETFGPGVWGREIGGKLRDVHSKAREIAGMWKGRGGKLHRRVETNLIYVDLQDARTSEADFCELGRIYGIKLDGYRIVVHYQISEEALRRLDGVFREVFSSH